ACLSSTASRCAPGSLSPGLSPVARFDGSASSYEPAQIAVSLRQSLPDADHFIHADNHSLQWLPALPASQEGCSDASWTLDTMEVEQALAQAEQAERVQEATAMRQALEQVMHLYSGELLPNCYDEWILPERDRWRQACLQAAERLIA